MKLFFLLLFEILFLNWVRKIFKDVDVAPTQEIVACTLALFFLMLVINTFFSYLPNINLLLKNYASIIITGFLTVIILIFRGRKRKFNRAQWYKSSIVAISFFLLITFFNLITNFNTGQSNNLNNDSDVDEVDTNPYWHYQSKPVTHSDAKNIIYRTNFFVFS